MTETPETAAPSGPPTCLSPEPEACPCLGSPDDDWTHFQVRVAQASLARRSSPIPIDAGHQGASCLSGAYQSCDRYRRCPKLFRTMVRDAEAMLPDVLILNDIVGPGFQLDDDPRVMKLGRLLRRTSVDELLQFWNVLKGDMSLVPPRPAPITEVGRARRGIAAASQPGHEPPAWRKSRHGVIASSTRRPTATSSASTPDRSGSISAS